MVSYSASGTVSVRPYVTVEGQPKTPASDGQWRRLQVLVVALCFLLNMLDGMDVLILSYIAPALSADWHVTPDRLACCSAQVWRAWRRAACGWRRWRTGSGGGG
jgi:hypothetical protein